ncbi:DUF4118 domain-containing protein [Sphingomonas sp.]|uniref:DUF4118 domain-containing protein n=1 Tax=Sphingomonas sp. TaxID=28214 RepID=UPI003AFFEA21
MPDTAREPVPSAAPVATHGKLKIFLGAAPGVGKTYEMLMDGGDRLRAGCDVVVGLIETHGRSEADLLVDAFEVVPRRDTGHPGRNSRELDLDALLTRCPQLVLIDDLAHANAEGGRHPRRWQDVDELLAAGIDVYATLDIRHVESLADVVAGITRLPVADTVPDGVLEAAEIEVVDLPPDELVRRLEEGKVHVAPEFGRALGHFFSRPVLSALREMVLRRVALSIDRQMLGELDAGAIPGTFAGGERVLVAVNELAGADTLVRAAKRLADALRAPWTAIYIETPRSQGFGEAQKRRVADALRLASTLGATIATVPANSVTDGLATQIEATRATQLVIGKSRRSWWFELRHGSVVDNMLRLRDGLAVHVIPASTSASPPGVGVERPGAGRGGHWGAPADYAAIAGFIAATAVFGRLLEPLIGLNAIDLLFLLPVILAASLYGLRPGLITAVAAGLTYNFFFLPPLYTLTVAEPQAGIALLVLVGIAAFTSRLTGRLKMRATLGAKSAHDNAAVAAFAQTLARVSEREPTASAICHEVARLLDVDSMLLGERDGALVPLASQPPGLTLGPVDGAAAEWAWRKGEPAGVGTATLNAADWQFAPLKTSLGTLAVLGVAREDGREPIAADRAVLMSALVGQAALAHERLHLEDDMRGLSVLQARDRMRTGMLAALGQELGGPLGAMVDAIGEAVAADSGSPSLASAKALGTRVQRLLADLSDLVRIDQGELELASEPVDLPEAVSTAAHDIQDRLRDTSIDLRVPPNLPRVEVDARFLNHVLVNLLLNAARSAGTTAKLVVEGRRTPDAILLAIAGAGEADAQAGKLPLAIARGFADALGVTIEATEQEGGGRTLTIAFPASLIVVPAVVS